MSRILGVISAGDHASRTGCRITVLFFERQFGYSGLLGIGLDSAGDPVIFQHLFWFFGHPEVYVIVLPAFGIVSASLENIRLAPTPSYLGMVLALFSISFVGFFVWAHHMFTVGMADVTRIYFSCVTLIIGVPTVVKIFAWSLALTAINFKD